MNKFKPLSEEQFYDLNVMLIAIEDDKVLSKKDIPECIERFGISEDLYNQVMDISNPNSIYSDYIDGTYYGKIQITEYSTYLKEYKRRMSYYRATYKVD